MAFTFSYGARQCRRYSRYRRHIVPIKKMPRRRTYHPRRDRFQGPSSRRCGRDGHNPSRGSRPYDRLTTRYLNLTNDYFALESLRRSRLSRTSNVTSCYSQKLSRRLSFYKASVFRRAVSTTIGASWSFTLQRNHQSPRLLNLIQSFLRGARRGNRRERTLASLTKWSVERGSL